MPSLLLTLLCAAAHARMFIRTHEVEVKDPGQSFQGVRFPAGTRLVLNEQDAVLNAFLGGPATFEGQRYGKGARLDFLSPGIVLTATLDAPQTVHGVRFAAGDEIHLDPKTRKLESVRAMTGGPIDVRGVRYSTAAVWVQFHPTERVREGVLDGDQSIGKARYRGGSRITFYADGKVRSGSLAKAATIDALALAPGTAVRFHENGRLRAGTLAAPQKISGVLAQEGFLLYPDGRPDYVCLAADRPVQELLGGKCCAKGSQLHFDPAQKPIGWGGRCNAPFDEP